MRPMVSCPQASGLGRSAALCERLDCADSPRSTKARAGKAVQRAQLTEALRYATEGAQSHERDFGHEDPRPVPAGERGRPSPTDSAMSRLPEWIILYKSPRQVSHHPPGLTRLASAPARPPLPKAEWPSDAVRVLLLRHVRHAACWE